MNRKKYILYLLLFILCFAGCSRLSANSKNSTGEKSAVKKLNELESKRFTIANKEIMKKDYETLLEFGKSFINLFRGAVENQKQVMLDHYITNANLLQYANQILEAEILSQSKGHNFTKYGLENAFYEMRIDRLSDYDNTHHLLMKFDYEGSGSGCEMLISVENKELKIVDFYFGEMDGADMAATGHPAERKVDNKDLWNNETWVNEALQRLEEYKQEVSAMN